MSNFENLVAASTPGPVYTDNEKLIGADAESLIATFYGAAVEDQEGYANIKLHCLARNHFPQAVELLRQAIGHLDQLAMPDPHAEQVQREAEALIAQIESDSTPK